MMKPMVTDDPQWYVQKGSRVQGPYSTNEVGRYLLLGRVRNTDRVSKDGELWEPVTQVPELIPEELLDLDSDQGWQRFVDARSHHDTRQVQETTEVERRAEVDTVPEAIRQEWGIANQQTSSAVLPWSLVGITLSALAVVLYLNSTGGL